MKTYVLYALVGFVLVTPSLFAQTAVTTPARIPEEARKHFVMGETMFKEAKSADNFSQAAGEFTEAAKLAPQWPEARYNLALAKEAAGDYSGAMADLKLYQQFKLSDSEARTVQDKIYALEAKAAVAAKQQKAEDKANSPEVKLEQFFKSLDGGKWRHDFHDATIGGFDEIICSGNTLAAKKFVAYERSGSIGIAGQTFDQWKQPLTGKQFATPGFGEYDRGPAQGAISDDGKTITIHTFSSIGNYTLVFTRE